MKTTHCAIRHTLVIVAAATAMLLGACASVPSPQPVAATKAATPELSTLSSLIAKAGLANTLNGAGSFTVSAPSNEAFKAVPAKTLEELSANPSRLMQVLTYHVLVGKAMAQDVKSGLAKTVQGSNIALAQAGAFVTVEDAHVAPWQRNHEQAFTSNLLEVGQKVSASTAAVILLIGRKAC